MFGSTLPSSVSSTVVCFLAFDKSHLINKVFSVFSSFRTPKTLIGGNVKGGNGGAHTHTDQTLL